MKLSTFISDTHYFYFLGNVIDISIIPRLANNYELVISGVQYLQVLHFNFFTYE